MSFKFSKHSLTQRATLHPDLQCVCNYLIERHDFRIQEGYRSPEAQAAALASGNSTLKKGKHNLEPSEAMDLWPYVDGQFIGFPDKLAANRREMCWRQWYYFAGLVMATGAMLHRFGEISHQLRPGVDWDRDDDLSDHQFIDAPHFELITP